MSHFASIVAAALEDTMSESRHTYTFSRYHQHWPNTLHDRIRTATAALLRGNFKQAWMGEHLAIESACVDGEELCITFLPTDGGQPFQAIFTLDRLEHMEPEVAPV